MTKYSFILLNGMQDSLVEAIQETGLVDITRSAKNLDDNSQKIKAEIELIDGLLQGLDKAAIPEGTLPREIPVQGKDIVRLTGSILMLYAEAQNEVATLSKDLEAVKAWGSWDKKTMDKLEEAGVKLHFHRTTHKAFNPDWAKEYPLKVISRRKNEVYFVVVGEDPLPGEIHAPNQDLGQVKALLKDAKANQAQMEGEIVTLRGRADELMQQRTELYAKLDAYLASCTAVPAAENTIVTLVGYAPTEKEATVSAALDKSGFFYIKEDAVASDNPPISLKNNWFVSQFETLTDMYGRPGYDGFDPTPFISIFFLLFFAFCMGDAGYGLILILAGILLKKVPSFKDMAPLVIILGAGTTVIGFLFHTFFSMDISQWAIFEPIKGIFLPAKIAGNDATMILALAVGILHLCLAMIVKTIQQTKTKGFYASLGTWGWTLLIVGGVTVAAFALAGVLSQDLTKWIVIALGSVSALGIFVFNNPERNKLANIGMGLWDTYNMVTGLMGDVLSYLRLYALGLAGSMLGTAFNDMGAMILGDGKLAVLWIPFFLIVVTGHTLNIAMCALGAFVHPLRLNFLEFFKNSGYEASGRAYDPLKK